jgi:deazaflavin-dependent oxidoreductase (nitroreductase family)
VDPSRKRTRMWGFRHVATRYLNPFTSLFAGWLPGFGILTHEGRTTGRTYRTPINVFERGGDYVFFLTYGSDVQWVKNVLAAGRCSLRTRGRDVVLADPVLSTDAELRIAPPVVRSIGRLIGATQFVRMRAA